MVKYYSMVRYADHIHDLSGKGEDLLIYNLAVLNDVDSDIVIDKAQDVEINGVDRTFYFDNVFAAHFIAAGIFNDGHTAVHLVQFQIVVDGHSLSGLDVVEYESIFNSSYI